MPAHKHAELMMEYAKDAMEIPNPWILWEYRSGPDQAWRGIGRMGASWLDDYEYRRKPEPRQRWILTCSDGKEYVARTEPKNGHLWWTGKASMEVVSSYQVKEVV